MKVRKQKVITQLSNFKINAPNTRRIENRELRIGISSSPAMAIARTTHALGLWTDTQLGLKGTARHALQIRARSSGLEYFVRRRNGLPSVQLVALSRD